MRECLELAPDAIEVDQASVVQRLGSSRTNCENGLFQESFTAAQGFLAATARPRCVVQTVDLATFAGLYDGEGSNDRDTPLEVILERSEALALFVLTLGQTITDTIRRLFSEHDYLVAALLDGMASLVAENLVESLETRFGRHIAECEGKSTTPAVLAYSPGYCGWHVSGQRALFSVLKPNEIGVSLGAGCMMRPLKSVSGVLVAGEPEIHDFDPGYSCCSGCDTLECRARIARVTGPVCTKREVAWICLDG